MDSENIKDIVLKDIIEKIKNLPVGSEIIVSKLVSNEYKLENKDLFDITRKVLEKCKEEGISVNAKNPSAIQGLPYNIPYIKN